MYHSIDNHSDCDEQNDLKVSLERHILFYHSIDNHSDCDEQMI